MKWRIKMHRNWWWWQSIEISTYFPIRIYYTHFFDKINIIDTRIKTNAIFVSWIFDCLFCIEMEEFPVLAARLWVYIEIWFEMQRIKYLSEKKIVSMMNTSISIFTFCPTGLNVLFCATIWHWATSTEALSIQCHIDASFNIYFHI